MPVRCLEVLQLELHLLAELQVERAERLVEQESGRPVHERSGKRDPLLLAAGELRRATILHALEPHGADHLRDASCDLVARSFLIFGPNAMFSATVMCGNSP